MSMIAVIPARSGSKGLPDKNIKLLAGKPLLSYSIEAALKANIFDTVMVSTDSERYAEIAKKYGAEVPFLRSEETASDAASTHDCIIEVLDKYKALGKNFDKVMILQPTSPLRSVKSIVGVVKAYRDCNANGIVSVCEVEHSPLWSNVLPEDKSMKGFLSNQANKPRQALRTYYRLNGAIYLYNSLYYCSNEDEYNDKVFAYIMPKDESIDIDSQFDFDLAECILQKRKIF